MHFQYPGSEISSDGRLAEELKAQTYKTAGVKRYLTAILFWDKYIPIKSKVMIYMVVVRPINII